MIGIGFVIAAVVIVAFFFDRDNQVSDGRSGAVLVAVEGEVLRHLCGPHTAHTGF